MKTWYPGWKRTAEKPLAGATENKEGKFELAHQSLLLLDEVTEMSLPLQAKLLRALQEHEVDKVGGKAPIPVGVRVIATTNRDIRRRIEDQGFREDLYYRLNVVPLTLIPLRERKDDIPLLAEYFMNQFCQENSRSLLILQTNCPPQEYIKDIESPRTARSYEMNELVKEDSSIRRGFTYDSENARNFGAIDARIDKLGEQMDRILNLAPPNPEELASAADVQVDPVVEEGSEIPTDEKNQVEEAGTETSTDENSQPEENGTETEPPEETS